MVLLLAGLACSPPAQAEGPLALTVAAAPLHVGPTPNSDVRGTLPMHTVVTAVATTVGLFPGVQKTWAGFPMVLVHSDQGPGWVAGDLVAIEPSDNTAPPPGQTMPRRQLGNTHVWFAQHNGAEWSAATEAWDRPVHEGWLVLQRGPDITTLPWSHANGWGTSRTVDTLIYRDFTADGHDDVLLVASETMTEVGFVGSTVQLWDLTRAENTPLLEVPVDEPHWNGLATQDRHGWVDLHFGLDRLDKQAVETGPCTPALPDPTARCISLRSESWTLSSSPVHTASTAPITALLPPSTAPVCLHAVRGPVGIGDPFDVEVRPCANPTAPGKWVPSTALQLASPMLAEILGPWPDSPSPYVRIHWSP